MNDQQENLLDHYSNPRNFGLPKFEANSKSKALNASCGDELEVFLRIENDIIKEISFVGEGCSIAIGSASQLYEYLLGKSIQEVVSTKEDTPENIIGIPLTISRKKCAQLSLETIKSAIRQYNKGI